MSLKKHLLQRENEDAQSNLFAESETEPTIHTTSTESNTQLDSNAAHAEVNTPHHQNSLPEDPSQDASVEVTSIDVDRFFGTCLLWIILFGFTLLCIFYGIL